MKMKIYHLSETSSSSNSPSAKLSSIELKVIDNHFAENKKIKHTKESAAKLISRVLKHKKNVENVRSFFSCHKYDCVRLNPFVYLWTGISPSPLIASSHNNARLNLLPGKINGLH